MQVQNAHFQGLELSYREIDALQREFQSILQDLAGNQSLLRFRHQYQRLYRALHRSNQNERILNNKISQLGRQMNDQTARIRTAIRMAQQDSQSITYLKQQLDKSYKMLEISKERQEKSKAYIERIQGRIRYLTSRLEERKALSSQQSNHLKDLTIEKENLLKEKEKKNTDLAQLKTKLSEALEQSRNLDSKREQMQQVNNNLLKEMKEVRDKLSKDMQRKKKIEQEVESLQKQKSKFQTELSMHCNNNNQLQSKIKEKENNIREITSAIQKLARENQRIKNQTKEHHDQNQALSRRKTAINEQLKRIDYQIQKSRKEHNQIQSKIDQTSKYNDILRNQTVKFKGDLQLVNNQNNVRIQSLKQLQRQVITAKKLNQEDSKQLKQLLAEKDTMGRYLDVHVRNANKTSQQINLINGQISNYEKKIELNQAGLKETAKNIRKLQEVKQKYGKQAAKAEADFMQTVEDIKLKGNQISQIQKKNLQTQNKLKHQQQLYEAVRSDRNKYAKTLSETLDEIAEIRRRYKIVNHQINQLKEEISAKEVALSKQRHQQKKKDGQIQDKSRSNQKLKRDFQLKADKIRNQSGEVNKLQAIIKDSQNNRLKLKQDYQLIVAQRDILGTQLIRRNDQSALLYQKIKIQQSKLAQGEAAYRQRQSDIKLLQYKTNDLKRQLKIYMKQANKIPVLQESIKNLQKQLIEEKLRVRALSQELQNPLNSHRLRNIGGHDPDTHQMKTQIQTLQRRLIQKTEQVIQKQVIIHQKQKQIKELSEIMAKQPGPDAAKRISYLQKSLKDRTDKMKSLAAELNMNQAQINQRKYDNEKIAKQIQQIQRRYFEQKKRQQLSKEAGFILDQR